ncbi:4-hydroxy-tetrahydrodipicolinate reductase [Lacibacterium aquatile]|uniref:4-hydroxy-tetrahydrodipicolinate reductase n=1 Tax=Lacibacterium aquatile TaxID=1168082 RepID=A0ABW5DQ68_9PROT
MSLRIVVAGATGWTGGAVAKAVADANDLALVGAVARRSAGQELHGLTLVASVKEALAVPADVLIDYTHPTAVKDHALAALAAGVHVVVGTSGLTAEDYREIDVAARGAGRGVVAAGNFSLTATLLTRFAQQAAEWIGDVEVIDYASAKKADVPSGTARELAEKLDAVRSHPSTTRPVAEILGPKEARGAAIGSVQVHSVRAPGFILSCEALFSLAGERLAIRHDAGESAEPYVSGTLLAARRVGGLIGLHRGLDAVLNG